VQNLSQRLASLSQDQRTLFALRLKNEKARQVQPDSIPALTQRSLFPLSLAQERLWFLYQLQPDNTDYNICSVIRLQGVINTHALWNALYEIVQRHEILRTTFAYVEGQPMQVVKTNAVIQLPCIDLELLSPDEQETQIRQLALQEARHPFNLDHGPVIRYLLLRSHAHAYVLVQTMHHIVCDGWSMRLLIEEFTAIYSAYARAEPKALPAKPTIHYSDFAVWQRRALQGKALDIDIAYWKKQLSGISRLQFPTHYRPTKIPPVHGARQFFSISTSTTEALKALSRRENATLFMTLLAGFQVLLHLFTGQDDISVGVSVANRLSAETERLIGFFVNILILRTDLSDNPTFRTQLQRVRETTLNAYSHQRLPFDQLIARLEPERAKQAIPLVTVGFDYQKDKKRLLQLPDLDVEFIELENGRPQFDLTLRIIDEGHSLYGRLDYKASMFQETLIQAMLNHYCVLLQEIVTYPELPLLDIMSTLDGSTQVEHPTFDANVDMFAFEENT
jgi:NRPS condensation-like uncharacterized protein